MDQEERTLVKTLSRNDIGATGGHQAGITVPRTPEALLFFPTLDSRINNPRIEIPFADRRSGSIVSLSFIYYNGRLLGSSTRNEYRLTGLTRYFRDRSALPGDRLEFSKTGDGTYEIDFSTGPDPEAESVAPDDGVIVLSGTWKTIRRGNFL